MAITDYTGFVPAFSIINLIFLAAVFVALVITLRFFKRGWIVSIILSTILAFVIVSITNSITQVPTLFGALTQMSTWIYFVVVIVLGLFIWIGHKSKILTVLGLGACGAVLVFIWFFESGVLDIKSKIIMSVLILPLLGAGIYLLMRHKDSLENDMERFREAKERLAEDVR